MSYNYITVWTAEIRQKKRLNWGVESLKLSQVLVRVESSVSRYRHNFFIFSVIIFVWVSNGLFDNFIKRRVIVTKSERKSGRDSLPSFLIGVCSRDSSFKDAQKTMYTVAEYMQNSANASKRILMKSAIIRKGQRQIKLQVSNQKFDQKLSKLRISSEIYHAIQ